MKVERFNKNYNLETIDDYLQRNKEALSVDISNALQQTNTELAVSKINNFVRDMHHCAQRPRNTPLTPNNSDVMNVANEKFRNYCECLASGNEVDISQSLEEYQLSRKVVTAVILQNESKKWYKSINDKNSKAMWACIDWKGNLSNNKLETHPTINELKSHFQDIYTPEDRLETTKIDEVSTDVYIPALDDPIDGREVQEALNDCKKGGYDITLPILQKIVSNLPMIIMLFNCLFYVYYPLKLACSLLFTIPKKGNLKLPSNFRGIQMLPTLGVLYDRILTKRLDRWLNVHDEQSGFRKGKSTLTQIFTLRLLIEMAKKTNTTLYIGCFDIQKAFDKVSRLLLFKKLVKCGIGFAMLKALKSIYTVTSCILTLKGKNSTEFSTSCGIRQGAPSSSQLFILFVNDLIDYIRVRCISEPLIESMHVLLHADDTLIVSTNRSLFVQKCNFMLQYFKENKLKLNFGKSGYLFINGKQGDLKNSIELTNAMIDYKNEIVYLGVIFTDTGNITNDVKLYIQGKRSHVTVKYSNFCTRNFLAPLKIKLAVLHSCVMSSLSYSCESWGAVSPVELETIYKMGMKTALSIRFSTCNEIAYIESGTYPVVCSIRKRQLKFWTNLNQNLSTNTSLEKLLKKASDINLPFITYYKDLIVKYGSATNCEYLLQTEFINHIKHKIRIAHDADVDSKLGAYLQVNPNLLTPSFKDDLFEIERIHLTRIRSGSHNLLIETGRFTTPRIPREARLCLCGSGIQTLRHVLMECPIVIQNSVSLENTFHTVAEYFNWDNLHEYLLTISKSLKIEL